MSKALLDTDIYSEILKAANPTVVQNAASYRQTYGVLTISVITMMEIVKGCQQAHAIVRLQRFLRAVSQEEILPLESTAAELAGKIAGDLDRTGQTIGMADPLIAAIAMQHGRNLVTGNASHFQRIIQLGYPLTLINWR